MKIADTSVLVTGGASGLGAATAAQLVRGGAYVTITDLPGSDGAATAAALGAGVRFVPADIRDDDQIRQALAVATDDGRPPLRGVVHCAGRGGDRLRILDRDGTPADVDRFREVLEVNLVGTYTVLRLAAEAMARNEPVDGERGAIVLTASVAAFDGQIGQTSYSASKGAVHAMTIVAARDLANRLIRVNTIAPGVFDTPMLARLRDDLRDQLAAGVPHPRRLGDPADYAHMATTLLENGYMNGETVRLDGAIRMPPR
ncbi:3-hydroxyacyl-CoA dehydrogenase, 17hydroxysteroid dehydrogenase type 10 (HSD10)-like [Pseudonocardia sp. Ae168_Ps1]|uniref:SDR family NAD(P)-dependent oxidoreductase n=1 Tax=unclassified Pseudonocardia TaxID=2619320 RepID=UPI0001FFEF38|nr:MULTISPECIES: SDR family NAD(P)-dependent oxidoreductase [unclassified Pseudonocardia]OLL76830.1 3-hydroxyacyl-CoA dehydrogenase 17hydroxysteroid dehydrogenase type 10 (HSD10)-like [Pseudonocardia sp. Ae150A_Ps1]OLL82844.1 3-hydroxyacyl-CoA dehydrogenase, 17hydroxysteroid dehydrogenase type 10 (HSD10)-like [Pseudonocardia sp. Ae168_Ps1]OLL83044.1 3-hydroxyacyl-CoA dehydrogenase, 17hydroxysteroid dehydrogenase type 10 (HSD10)-like [Pseudonocardia sp. Ae263_Ps1]OLL90917.1 3-hydroxyacyl-CoA deh